MSNHRSTRMMLATFFQHLQEMTEVPNSTENNHDNLICQEPIQISLRVVMRSEGDINTENLVLAHSLYQHQQEIVNQLLRVITSTSSTVESTDEEILISREMLRVSFAESVVSATIFSIL